MNVIRLMLVDDHQVVRTGLKTFLETKENFLVVAEASSGEIAVQTAAEAHPNVIIMDISMPEMDGLEATRRLKATCPESKVLALTVHEDKRYFFEMLAAGASGYVTKQAAADELVAAIHAVAEGNVYLQPVLAKCLLEDYKRLSAGAWRGDSASEDCSVLADVLSQRERQVLELIAQGKTNVQIGENLGISPKTVARHRERIMQKLEIHSCTELVKYAIRMGLINLN
jgi:two-component system response regulator NreC